MDPDNLPFSYLILVQTVFAAMDFTNLLFDNGTLSNFFPNRSNITATLTPSVENMTSTLFKTTVYWENGPSDFNLVSGAIIKIICPFLFIIGMTGNIVSILILLKKKNRVTATALFLTVLSISDIVIILTSIVTVWVRLIWNYYIRNIHSVFCKLHVFLTYFSVQFSSWILVLITLERILCVFIPHKVKQFLGREKGLVFIAIQAMVLLLVNGHLLFTVSVDERLLDVKCVVFHSGFSYDLFFAKAWPWIDLSLAFGIPCLFILMGNLAIFIQLSCRRRNLGTTHQRYHSRTVLLVLLSAVFIASMAPATLFFAVSYLHEWAAQNYDSILDILTVATVLNPTMNFILYFLSGSKFRAEVKGFFCCGESQTGHVF